MLSHGINTNILKKYINELSCEQIKAVDNRNLIKALDLGVSLDQYIELIKPT